ncbi:zincin [Piromyces finnis]|uniref:Zincin n=1 Tax=Piromyces finnis TaxID=1754191 RepID=A0A1Y1UNR0_9FUNG|nr:zincin [Piromyces finnis]ORX42292.1 zincin [Piromyces finnis]|eukprot:ORX38765.1 zincin [Piromyces finnis]
MKFQQIGVVLTFLSLNLNGALSLPANKIGSRIDELDPQKIDDIFGINVNLRRPNITAILSKISDKIQEGKDKIKKYKKDEVCMTDECVESSKKILSSMDTTVDPCDDFYQYACGGWMEQNEIPSNSVSISTSIKGNARNMEIIKNILERDYKVNENLSPEEQELDKNLFNKLKTIFNTCMDVDKINAKGKQPLIDLYDKLKIYENRENYKDVNKFTEQLVTLNKYGIFPFFKIGGHTDYEKANHYLIAFLQNGLTLSKDYYSYDVVLVELRKYIKNILTLIFDSTERDIDAMADSILEFEKKVANAYVPSVKLQNPQFYYNKRTIKELSERYPKINWSLFFKQRLANHNIDFEFDDETIFIDMTPDYLTTLNEILEESDVDSIAYYLEWRVIDRFYEYLSSDLQGPVKEFSDFLYGGSVETPLYDKCSSMVDDMMEMAVGKYFVEEAFDSNTKPAVKEVFKNIKQSMIERIPQMEWLDKETSDYAIEKVKMIKENIAYPDYLMDLEKMTKKYEYLELNPDDYLGNVISYLNMYYRNDLNRIVEPTSDWRYSPQTFNGFYYPPDNSINILAGILQSPFYDSHEPDYINYGGLGMLVGHELTHAFDGTGRQFDKNGSMTNWWTSSTAENFSNASQCFVNQYSNYTIVGSDGNNYNVDGEFTLNENISDNGGVDRAYEAWKISMNNDEKEAKERNKILPDFTKYTRDQLFFISFGQIWCSKMRPEVAVQRLSQDNHAPSEWRVKGVLRNSKYFAKAFNCPVNSPMNPEQKCSIW